MQRDTVLTQNDGKRTLGLKRRFGTRFRERVITNSFHAKCWKTQLSKIKRTIDGSVFLRFLALVFVCTFREEILAHDLEIKSGRDK